MLYTCLKTMYFGTEYKRKWSLCCALWTVFHWPFLGTWRWYWLLFLFCTLAKCYPKSTIFLGLNLLLLTHLSLAHRSPPPPARSGILSSLSVLNAASAYFPPHLHPVMWSCCSGSQQTAQMFYSWMNEEGDLSYWGSPKICWSLSLQWMWLNLEVSSL